jgi:hypothetical protein
MYHDQERSALVLAGVVYGKDVGMIQPAEELGSLMEAPHPIDVVAHFLEHFERDFAFNAGRNAL